MLWVDMVVDDTVPETPVIKSAAGLTFGDVMKCFTSGDLVYVHFPMAPIGESGQFSEAVMLISRYSYVSGEVERHTFSSDGGMDFAGDSLDDVFALDMG